MLKVFKKQEDTITKERVGELIHDVILNYTDTNPDSKNFKALAVQRADVIEELIRMFCPEAHDDLASAGSIRSSWEHQGFMEYQQRTYDSMNENNYDDNEDYITNHYRFSVREIRLAADKEQRQRATVYFGYLEENIRQQYGVEFLNSLRQANGLDPYPA